MAAHEEGSSTGTRSAGTSGGVRRPTIHFTPLPHPGRQPYLPSFSPTWRSSTQAGHSSGSGELWAISARISGSRCTAHATAPLNVGAVCNHGRRPPTSRQWA
jgi:hypothetical protein